VHDPTPRADGTITVELRQRHINSWGRGVEGASFLLGIPAEHLEHVDPSKPAPSLDCYDGRDTAWRRLQDAINDDDQPPKPAA
jgi:hypothetical protein